MWVFNKFNLYFLNKYLLMKNIYRLLFNKNLLNEYYYDYENKIIYQYYIEKVFKEIYLK